MVVRLSDGRDAVRAYVSGEASQGRDHVRALVAKDVERVEALVAGVSDEDGAQQPRPGEWSMAEVLAHVNASLDRSQARLQALSSGQEWTNPPVVPGRTDLADRQVDELAAEYRTGMQAILQVLDAADVTRGLELTADHATFGPFNWLEWAVYSHHVHVHDHIGQLEECLEAIRDD